MDEKSRVYILTDDENRITRLEGEYTLPSDLVGWILVEEGEPCDRLNLAQTHYLDKPIFEDHGVPIYKFENGEILERAAEEIEADIPPVAVEPTQLDRIEAQTIWTALMTDTLIEEV